MPSIGVRLKKVIEDSGLTISEFAKKTGVSKNSIINYRDEKRSPDANFIIEVCLCFNVRPGWLLFGNVKNCGQCSCTSDNLHEKAMGMISEVESETGCRLNDKQRQAVTLILEQELKKGTQKAAINTFVCECGRGYRIHVLSK